MELKDMLRKQEIGALVTYEEMSNELRKEVNTPENRYIVSSAIDQLRKNDGCYYINERELGYRRVDESDYITYERSFRVSQRRNSCTRSNRYLKKIDVAKLDDEDKRQYFQLQALNVLVYEITKKKSQQLLDKIDNQEKYNVLATIDLMKKLNVG